MTETRKTTPQSSREQGNPAGCLLRLFWMAAGNALLGACFFGIAFRPPWQFSWFDAAFWGLVLLLLSVRYVDLTRMGGLTGDGDPPESGTFRRYVLVLVAVATVSWLVAQSIRI